MPAAITPEEIKSIRSSYGLSQKSFALLLGIGPASIVRYEQGATPSKANANLIRAARNPQFMAECLEADGDQIPETQRVRAESVVYDYISLDQDENERMHEGLDVSGLPSTMSMSEVYHFTLQQEILNEQAANLIADVIAAKRVTGDKEGVYATLLNRLAQIKPNIISEATMDDKKLAEIRGFLSLASDLLGEQIVRAAS
ncbi:MAG: helix-turn-helix domain-containing protein [Eggerthellaceae bacterium]|nr:helix-turn-helix domain-containing protein [Eggerthellaceae bacterium]